MWGVDTGYISSTKKEVLFRCQVLHMGKSLFSTSYVEMEVTGDVCQKMRYKVSFTIATLLYSGHFGAEKTVAKVL